MRPDGRGTVRDDEIIPKDDGDNCKCTYLVKMVHLNAAHSDMLVN